MNARSSVQCENGLTAPRRDSTMTCPLVVVIAVIKPPVAAQAQGNPALLMIKPGAAAVVARRKAQ
jgi:hypothetical protein